MGLIMKTVNLLSLIQMSSLGEIFNNFLALSNINPKEQEIEGIRNLIKNLDNEKITANQYDDFYIGYTIPQIGKEFDLLRLGKNFHLNIELKSEQDLNEIKIQLIRNKFYLEFLDVETCYITFAYNKENKTFHFYQLNQDNDLVEITPTDFAKLLKSQIIDRNALIDTKFIPSNYLVSPFNSTENFLQQKYFLTQNQEQIKKKIENLINTNPANTSLFISLTGIAGTGKTLLTYDIAHSFQKNTMKILILHCGILNDGHLLLKEKGWNISSIKYFSQSLNNDFDIIIIDEAQRLSTKQFNEIKQAITNNNQKCIFAFDKQQTISNKEKLNDITSLINQIPNIRSFSLTDKVRTNKEIANFIKGIFNNRRNDLSICNDGNIEIIYFNNLDTINNYIQNIDNSEWEMIKFTPSQYNAEYHQEYSKNISNTSHKVIGQEFDNVALIIDDFFTYDTNGNLTYLQNTYYNPIQMLFQNITRVRKKLKLLLINNPVILERCIQLLK